MFSQSKRLHTRIILANLKKNINTYLQLIVGPGSGGGAAVEGGGQQDGVPARQGNRGGGGTLGGKVSFILIGGRVSSFINFLKSNWVFSYFLCQQ